MEAFTESSSRLELFVDWAARVPAGYEFQQLCRWHMDIITLCIHSLSFPS
jgi:hypothetical protein